MLPKGGKEPFCLLSIDGPGLFGKSNPELFQRFHRLPSPDEEDCELETDDGCVRKLGGQRPEEPERANRRTLRERADRGRGPGHRIVRRKLRRSVELPLQRGAMPHLPERKAVTQLRCRVGPARGTCEQPQLRVT